jgi:cysteine synthase A
VPDDQAAEKYALLERLGAHLEKVRPASIVLPEHFVNVAKRRAKEWDDQMQQSGVPARGFFSDQFENLANFKAHYGGTGPEIWEQTKGRVDYFVMGAGTGGTIAGVGRYLKERNPHVGVVLADPRGSGLYNRVKHGVMYAKEEAEGTRRRHQVDTIVEGIGINRLTQNMKQALGDDHMAYVDDAYTVTDQEAVHMARWLVEHDGIFVGSSSCVNLVAAVRVARKSPANTVIVTLLCDSGQRHLTKFWSDDFLKQHGLDTSTPTSLDFIR